MAGQELIFTSDVNHDFCFANTTVEIKGQFIRTKLIWNIPIAVFLPHNHKKWSYQLIYDMYINTLLQKKRPQFTLSKTIFLSKFTVHSIRVRFYVTLQVLNKTYIVHLIPASLVFQCLEHVPPQHSSSHRSTLWDTSSNNDN